MLVNQIDHQNVVGVVFHFVWCQKMESNKVVEKLKSTVTSRNRFESMLVEQPKILAYRR